jgi:hypothetical protein
MTVMMSRFRVLLSLSATLTIALASSIAVAGERPGRPAAYRFETIDVPGATATYVFGLNERGQTVGRIGSEETGDAWAASQKSGLVTFDFPGAPFTEAFEITDTGVIAGWFTDAAGVAHGFVRNRKGFKQIDVPGGAWTIVLAGRSRGDLAGFYGDAADPDVQHGFIRDKAGRFTFFDAPGATITQPFGMNDRGVVVGVFSQGGEERAS